MRLNSKFYLIPVIAFALLVIFILTAPDSLFERMPNNKRQRFNYLWHRIKNEKVLTAITHNNSLSYFIYRGRPMGLHYDLLKEYCKTIGVELHVNVEDDLEKALYKVKKGEADVLAIDLTYTKPRRGRINFTDAVGYNHQVLVQRRRKNRKDRNYVTSVLDLEGKRVYVQKGTVFKNQLEYLQEQTGSDFEIIEDPDRTMEDLIEAVADGNIDYTACDERAAMVNATYYPVLDYSLRISAKQKLCWAVPPFEDSLKISINRWLQSFRKTKKFAVLQKKYLSKSRRRSFSQDKYLPGKGGQLTPYDEIIKKYAAEIGWDWRLLASLIYQESRFNNTMVSWAGAVGLMQIMPETAKRMGVADVRSPEGNIKAGVKFLKWLENQLKKEVADSAERIKFVLAAYNSGLGHVLDARRLAEKYEKNPNVWTNQTDTFILLKSKPKYYHDKVVKYGFCHGKETYDFVKEILNRYNDYRNLVKEG